MTNDNSGRSSVAGSAHATSPKENELDVPAQEAQQADAAAPDMSPSTISNTNQSNQIDTDAPVAPAAESQPMTASNSNSSNPSAIDGLGSGTGLAAPYGTRSRNRTGTSRPNYAEDKELDVEFEIAASSKEGRKAIRGAADPGLATSSDVGRAGNKNGKNQGPEPDQIVAGQPHSREPIPGTFTFSAQLTTTAPAGQSKKRKANGASATSHLQPQSQLPNHTTVPAVTRRASIAAQGTVALRETNMLSFDDCGSRLNKAKKLVADDGTVLEVNGKSNKLLEPE